MSTSTTQQSQDISTSPQLLTPINSPQPNDSVSSHKRRLPSDKEHNNGKSTSTNATNSPNPTYYTESLPVSEYCHINFDIDNIPLPHPRATSIDQHNTNLQILLHHYNLIENNQPAYTQFC